MGSASVMEEMVVLAVVAAEATMLETENDSTACHDVEFRNNKTPPSPKVQGRVRIQ